MKQVLTIAGLGPGDPAMLPVKTWEALAGASKVLIRTERHPTTPELVKRGIVYEALDRFYEQAASFEDVYRNISGYVLAAVRESKGPVLYAVPGHPLIAETTVQLLMEGAAASGIDITVLPALSCLDAVISAMNLAPSRGLHVLDALSFTPEQLCPNLDTFLIQIYNRQVASEAKLTLMERYPDEYPVVVVQAAGVPGREHVVHLPLFEVDRLSWLDHLTTLYLPALSSEPRKKDSLDRLVEVMATLRGEHGCPWDREQNHQSLKRYVLEEAYEVADAIETLNMHNLCEELGDLLLQVVFHSQLAREAGLFDISDVIGGIVQKLIRRHPHVFSGVEANTPAQVITNWEEIKAGERGPGQKSGLNIPRALPALVRAEKAQAAAARVGFDWPEIEGAWAKIIEEMEELQGAITAGKRESIAEEVGDLLFAGVNVARFLGIDPEETLSSSVDKLIRRFQSMEEQARLSGRELGKMTLQEMDLLWEKVKKLR